MCHRFYPDCVQVVSGATNLWIRYTDSRVFNHSSPWKHETNGPSCNKSHNFGFVFNGKMQLTISSFLLAHKLEKQILLLTATLGNGVINFRAEFQHFRCKFENCVHNRCPVRDYVVSVDSFHFPGKISWKYVSFFL